MAFSGARRPTSSISTVLAPVLQPVVLAAVLCSLATLTLLVALVAVVDLNKLVGAAVWTGGDATPEVSIDITPVGMPIHVVVMVGGTTEDGA